MDQRPGTGVTGGAIAAGRKIFADGETSQTAIYIVTGGTTVVGIRRCSCRSISVTGGAAGRRHLHQRAVIRWGAGVSRFPAIDMAGGAIARSRLASRQADQVSGGTVMTNGAGIMGVCS